MTATGIEADRSFPERRIAAEPAGGRRVRARRALDLLVRGRWTGWLAALALLGPLALGTGYRYEAPAKNPQTVTPQTVTPQRVSPDGAAARLAELSAERPRGVYVVIDRVHNRLWLKRGEEVLLEAIGSTGSGNLLVDPASGREWRFETPTGLFHVRSKIANPAWRKPDWAFVEVGEPVPTDVGARIELGSLGEYALDLGDGYLIHGTLYERLLGRSVTHGCIRLGREDLRQVWRATRVGTPVYIF